MNIINITINPKFTLGVLNSRLISYWFAQKFGKLQRETFPRFKVNELATFPIRVLNLSNESEKAQHDRMVALVETMLNLHEQKAASKTTDGVLERQITETDKAIDALVYQLYDLTPEEIAIVEGSVKS